MIETYRLNPVEPVWESMTFSQYFDTNETVGEVLASFGYRYDVQSLALPEYPGDVSWVQPLQERVATALRQITLFSEISRREFLIAPIIMELAHRYGVEVRSEYTLKVNHRLQGNIDYLLLKDNNLVVIEAKQGDMARGFRQLVTEMVAVDMWNRSPLPLLYGAVTVGNSWQFARLDRQSKEMVQDKGFLNIPDDMERVVRVLIATLMNDEVAFP